MAGKKQWLTETFKPMSLPGYDQPPEALKTQASETCSGAFGGCFLVLFYMYCPDSTPALSSARPSASVWVDVLGYSLCLLQRVLEPLWHLNLGTH